MTHDERISAYIDNELSLDQEQEFLISLAASEGLRKSFRSELVLKNVLHRDEATTNPPRAMRGAVFAALGIGAAAVTADQAKAEAVRTPARGLMKTFFATKLNTLVTAAGLSISALAGYGVHTLVAPVPAAVTAVPSQQSSKVPATEMSAPAQAPAVGTSEPSQQAAAMSDHGQVSERGNTVAHHGRTHSLAARVSKPASGVGSANSDAKSAVSGTAGGGEVKMEDPKINH